MAESGKFYNVQLADQPASGKVYKVRDVTDEKNVSGKVYQVKGLGGGVEINNQDINVTQNGIYQAEEGYTGLGTVNVNVASGSPTQKFGATIDNFLGNVDADGNYIAPSEPVEVNLVGVKSVPRNGFYYGFVHTAVNVFNANDVEFIEFSSFQNAFYGNDFIQEAHFDGVEQVPPSSNNCFSYAFSACTKLKKITFNKLKICNSNSAFAKIFGDAENSTLNISEVFPVLEEIKGTSAFDGFIYSYYYATKSIPIEFPSLKIIEGHATSKYSSTFGSTAYTNLIYKFPNVTQITGYVWNSTAVFEIHFAAANQAAIEACEGYDYKWGATNASLFFDL